MEKRDSNCDNDGDGNNNTAVILTAIVAIHENNKSLLLKKYT